MKTFNLNHEPIDYVISLQLRQLIDFYSTSEVRAACYLWNAGLESSQNMIIAHLDNLALTYSRESVNDILKLFNIDDRALDMSQDEAV